MKYEIFIMVSLFIVAATACGNGQQHNKSKKIDPVLVEVQGIQKSVQKQQRRFSGYTLPWQSSGVGFMAGGRVTSIKVKEGQKVEKGQLIATLAPEDYNLYNQLADIQLQALEPNLKRVEKLVQEKVLPASQLDEIKGKYLAAKTQQKQARKKLADTKLFAPITGYVMKKSTNVGQIVGTGSPVVILLDLDTIKVSFGIPQSDLKFFKKGETITLTSPGVANNIIGIVDHIDLVPDTTTHTFGVDIKIDNNDMVLRAGLLCHTFITTKQVEGYFVPLSSIKRNTKGELVVMVLGSNGQVREQPVQVGAVFGELVKIETGLSSGITIVTRGQHFIGDGDLVRVKQI